MSARRKNFEQVRAATARNVPLDKLDPFALMKSRTSAPEQPLYLYLRRRRPQRLGLRTDDGGRLRKRGQRRGRHASLVRGRAADRTRSVTEFRAHGPGATPSCGKCCSVATSSQLPLIAIEYQNVRHAFADLRHLVAFDLAIELQEDGGIAVWEIAARTTESRAYRRCDECAARRDIRLINQP